MQEIIFKGSAGSDAHAHRGEAPVWLFASATLMLMVASAIFVGWMPLQLSVVTVFLFAGPHNWMEFRYFVSRMPARWGATRNFFQLAIGGAILLTATYSVLPFAARALAWEDAGWLTATAVWNSLLVGWILALVHLRSRERPRRDWSWTLPAGFALIGLSWMMPYYWSLALVYLHPLVAFWFLDRQLGKSRPRWRGAYRMCLACLPLVVGVLWWQLADAPSFAGDDALTLHITRHAGAGLLTGVSSQLLVSTHVFLETLHYGVWLLAIPLVSLRVAPWRTERIPLVTHPRGWPRTLRTLLVLGACVVVLLWLCFLADYPTTRDIYFTAAMLHVLAEVPFLLRML